MLKQTLLQQMPEAQLSEEVTLLQKKFHGFLNEEGAIRIIASKHGIQPEKKPFTLKKISQLVPGETASFNCILLNCQSVRVFEKDGRKGFVTNATVADETGEISLVLWGKDAFSLRKFERNSFLLVKNAFVKEKEAHSKLVTEILQGQENPAFPKSLVKSIPLTNANGLLNFDAFGRVLEKSPAKEFNVKGKPGKLVKAQVADDSGQSNVVFWNSNADELARFVVGDAVKLEGAYEKDGEIHLGKDGRVISPVKHSLEKREELYAKHFPRLNISQAKEGEQCIISAEITKALSLNAFYKCTCGKKPLTKQCECGKTANETLVLNAEIEDASVSTKCAFFNENAMLVLGIKEASIDYNTLFSLKRDYLTHNVVTFIALPKFSSFTKKMELSAKHVLSIKSQYEMPKVN